MPQLHFQYKVGALGGGNDVHSGEFTLEEAFLHCHKLPNGVGFTYQGKPDQQGKLMCYFKSSVGGNQDPNWQTYLKQEDEVISCTRASGFCPVPALCTRICTRPVRHPQFQRWVALRCVALR